MIIHVEKPNTFLYNVCSKKLTINKEVWPSAICIHMKRLGIDIGSTTVKVAVIDKEHKILFSEYKRHFANIRETLKELLCDARKALCREQPQAACPLCIPLFL